MTFYILCNIMWFFWYKTQSRTENKMKVATDICRKIVWTGKFAFRANAQCCFLFQYFSPVIHLHYSIYFHKKEKTPWVGRHVKETNWISAWLNQWTVMDGYRRQLYHVLLRKPLWIYDEWVEIDKTQLHFCSNHLYENLIYTKTNDKYRMSSLMSNLD